MLFAASCLAAAVAVMLCSPLLLRVGGWQIAHPGVALTAWFSALFAGIALTLTAVGATIVAAIATAQALSAWEAITVTVAAWLGLGGSGAVIALVAASAQPLADSYRDAVAGIAPVATSRERRAGFTLVRFDADEPVAVAVPGRHPEILISSALERALTPPQLRAVLAHEVAHLRFRHGWAVRIAELNALCLPRPLRGARALKRATLLLVELMADDEAARRAGAANLANALQRLGDVTGDPGLQLRARRLAGRRWPVSARRRASRAIEA